MVACVPLPLVAWTQFVSRGHGAIGESAGMKTAISEVSSETKNVDPQSVGAAAAKSLNGGL